MGVFCRHCIGFVLRCTKNKNEYSKIEKRMKRIFNPYAGGGVWPIQNDAKMAGTLTYGYSYGSTH